MERKYVVLFNEEIGEQLFTCPKSVNHDDFAEALRNMRMGFFRDNPRPYRKPISAGFTDGKKCYGRSESLNINSRPQDANLL